MNQSNEHFSSLRRHEEYFLSGGDLFFLIQHTIFRVHRYFYERESDFFRNILATPASPGALRQGTAEANAIVLDNITPDEFAKFNWVFYNPKYSLYNRPVEDWTVILSLAHRWGFPEVHALAVRELEKLEFPDLDRIVVYHKYDVDRRLLVTRYAALCEREEPLTVEEGARLGMETAMTIAQGREIARAIPAAPGGPRLPKAAGLPFEEMAVIIEDLFGVVPPSPVESPAGLVPRKVSLSTATASTLGAKAKDDKSPGATAGPASRPTASTTAPANGTPAVPVKPAALKGGTVVGSGDTLPTAASSTGATGGPSAAGKMGVPSSDTGTTATTGGLGAPPATGAAGTGSTKPAGTSTVVSPTNSNKENKDGNQNGTIGAGASDKSKADTAGDKPGNGNDTAKTPTLDKLASPNGRSESPSGKKKKGNSRASP